MVRLVKNVGKNQDELEAGDLIYFFSYDALVAVYDREKKIYERTAEYHSATTQKQIDRWVKRRPGTVYEVPQEELEAMLIPDFEPEEKPKEKTSVNPD